MHIGLTYDLRSEYLAMGYGEEETAEFDHEVTIIALETTLQQLGHSTDRIGRLHELLERLRVGDRWDLVFNIAEGMFGLSREAQIPALLDAWRIPYTFADACTLGLCLQKAMTKRVVHDVGIPTARHWTVEQLEDLADIDFPPPYFAKPLAEGTGKGVHAGSVIHDFETLKERCRELLERYQQPALVETFLPGREFTVGIVGTARHAEVIGIMEVILLDNAEQNVYSYVNKEKCADQVEYRLCDPAQDRESAQAGEYALAAWKVLGCRDAGRVDMRSDDAGLVHFIEVNPLAGMRPNYSDLPILADKAGVDYVELIRRIVASAADRIPSAAPGLLSPLVTG